MYLALDWSPAYFWHQPVFLVCIVPLILIGLAHYFKLKSLLMYVVNDALGIYYMAMFYLVKCILNRRRKREEEKKEKFIITHESAHWTRNIKIAQRVGRL